MSYPSYNNAKGNVSQHSDYNTTGGTIMNIKPGVTA